MSIYRDTCTDTGNDPAVLRCDTPGHAEVTGDWETAPWRGWDVPARGTSTPGLHPAGLRRCPQCVQEIQKATMDAQERDCAATASCATAMDEWTAAQRATLRLPRWSAAGTPDGTVIPAQWYGTYADSVFLERLFATCDTHFPVTRWQRTARPAPALEQLPEPATQEAASPPAEEEDAGITAVIGLLAPDGEEDFWAEADAREAGHRGHTAPLPVVTADGEVPA